MSGLRSVFRAVCVPCLVLVAVAHAGTVSGQLQTPTGGVVPNATITFTLSQPAVLSGTAAVVPATASCYTSTAGNVVGVPDPLVLPIVSANYGSGTLGSGTYYVKITYTGASSTTSVASPETTFLMTGSGTLIVTPSILQPASATGYAVYISTSSGTETLQGTVTGFVSSYQQSSALVSGAALPGSNTSACTLRFSDELIPTGTSYSVSLISSSGSRYAGYPQTWCTYGGSAGTINVSNGAPTGNCGSLGVFYPTPIFASPLNNAIQSIAGALAATWFKSTVSDAVTPPFVATNIHVSASGLRVNSLDPTTVVDTTNPVTLLFPNPASPVNITFPDPGGSANVLYDAKGTVDCAVMTCKRMPWVWFVGASANNTTASAGLDNFGGSSPTPFVVSGTNVIKGVLAFPAAVTWIQENANATASAATVTVTYPATTTAGDLLLAEISFDSTRTITGCTDTTNAYTQAFHSTNGALSVDVWYFNGNSTSKAAASTLTCTFSANAAAAIVWHEYSGSLTAAILDKTATSNGTGTACGTGTTAATTQASELVLAVCGTLSSAPSMTAASNMTQHTVKAQSTTVEVSSAGMIVNATGTQTSSTTLGASSTWSGGIATFKANVASSATAQTQYGLPSSFLLASGMNGAWRFQAPQAAGSASNAIIGQQISCVQDGSTDDPAFNTATASTAAVPTTANTLKTVTLSTLSTTGCVNATAQQLHIQWVRQRYTNGDNFEGWIYMNGGGLQYGENGR